MEGVDFHDMLVALYRRNTGVRRYYLCTVFHQLKVCDFYTAVIEPNKGLKNADHFLFSHQK